MARLKTLKPRLATLDTSRRPMAKSASENRMAGRKLQDRRLRLWVQAEGRCACCGRITSYPSGFDLDHRVPLYQGGQDTDENSQVLCNGPDGCHQRKTTEDAGRLMQGWPPGASKL